MHRGEAEAWLCALELVNLREKTLCGKKSSNANITTLLGSITAWQSLGWAHNSPETCEMFMV